MSNANLALKPEGEAARYKRMRRVEQMLLSGIRSTEQIAAAFGVTYRQARKWVEDIREEWKESVTARDDARIERIRQIENLAHISLNAYERSKADLREVTIKDEDCDKCDATGKVRIQPPPNEKFKVCPKCSGEGYRTVEIVKVKGNKPGDANFLRLAKDCFVECGKLQGLSAGLGKVQTTRRMVESGIAMGGEIQEQIEEIYFEGPTDLIISAMAVQEKFRREVKQIERKPDDGNTIDVMPKGDDTD